MSQHDFNIANQGFPATRADINNAFQAIASNSSGPTAPSTTYANQWWYDTTNDKMYLRNAADSAWIEVAVIDQTNNEWKITSGVIQAVDGDGIVLKTDDGITRFTLDDTGNATFAEGTDIITGSAGTDNVRIGAGAGDSIEAGGNNNVAVGTDALTANTTASNNTAVGYQAGYSSTTATGLALLGKGAGYSNTTGSSNTVQGLDAFYYNTTGSFNTAIGRDALQSNTTASYNTAVGYQALYSNTTAQLNIAVGYEAGRNSVNSNSTLVGAYSGYNLSYSGTGQNTFIGYNSGNSMTTGRYNTILGSYNGNQNGLDIRTSSNIIVLSDGDGNPRGVFSSDGFFSTAGKVTPDDTTIGVHLKKSGTTTGRVTFTGNGGSSDAGFYGTDTGGSGVFIVRPNGNVQNQNNSYGAISDQNLKENIQDASSQWDDIKSLRVRKYSLISEQSDTPTQLGVIAQEVEAAGMSGLVHETWDIANPDVNIKHVKYSILYMKAVKALQEAMDRIETLETKVAALEAN